MTPKQEWDALCDVRARAQERYNAVNTEVMAARPRASAAQFARLQAAQDELVAATDEERHFRETHPTIITDD